MLLVETLVKFGSQDAKIAQRSRSNRAGILADPAGKDQGINAVEGSAEAKDCLGQTVAENLDSQIRADIALTERLQKGAHIIAESGDTEKAALAIKNVRDPGKVVIQASRQEIMKVGVDVSASRPHDESLERRQSHRGVTALTFSDGARAASVSKMRGNQMQLLNRPLQKSGRLFRNEVMARSMKAVAPRFVFLIEAVWDGIQIGSVRHRLMERGVEDRDMGDFRKLLHRSLDSDQVGGIVQGSQLAAVFDSLNYIRINPHAVFERLSPMDNPMSNADNFQAAHLMKDFVKHLEMPGVWQRYLMARSSGEFCLQPGVRRTQAFSQSLDFCLSAVGVND